MNLEFTAADKAFRDEVRAFLKDNLTPELAAAGRKATSVFIEPEYTLAWQAKLNERGWVAPHWPKEYGGPGFTETQKAIFAAEFAAAGAPSLSPMGLSMVGPCIIGYGTPEQKAHYLPRLLNGEDYWCQGYSEPGSGSDLASLQLKAERDGDDYVLNGTKIWTTHAHHANKMFCLVRTRTEGKPQTGITFLLLDMKTPGIKVDPIRTMTGEHEFNQVFFDDVRVPVSGRLGEENDGWTVAKYLLEFERGGGTSAGVKAALHRLRRYRIMKGIDDPILAKKLEQVSIKVEALLMTEHRIVASLSAGASPGPAASILKAQRTELMQEVDEIGIEMAGIFAGVYEPASWLPTPNITPVGPDELAVAMPRYLNDRAASIYGGSNEVQRNIVAKAVLRL